MYTAPQVISAKKSEMYAELKQGIVAMLEGERDFIANTANCAALLFLTLPDINWSGFYFLKNRELVLGPFQGKPACIRIALGRGVCGTAASTRQTIIVPNVHEFSGHIACDSASNSEIVVPLIMNDQLVGVLDIDSASFNRFDEEDAAGLQSIAAAILEGSDLPNQA